MASGIKVENRDEEASLRCRLGTFYFGPYYDDGIPEEDEDRYYEWKFVWTKPDRTVVCVIPSSELPGHEPHSYDEATALLLCGIGHCIEQGWIKEGDISHGESKQETPG